MGVVRQPDLPPQPVRAAGPAAGGQGAARADRLGLPADPRRGRDRRRHRPQPPPQPGRAGPPGRRDRRHGRRLRRRHRGHRPRRRGKGVLRARRPAGRGPGVGQGRGALEEPARLPGRPHLLGRRRHPQLPRPLRLRAARPPAAPPGDPLREGVLRAARSASATPCGPPAAAGSPSCWPGPSSTCSGRSWPGSCSRCRASTPGAARPSSRCRSSPATGSSWACWSISPPGSGSTPSPRSTWTGASTATRTCRRSAG